MQRKKLVIYHILIFAALFTAAAITLYINSIRAYELCQDCIACGWDNNLKYSMISKELKSIISGDEFTNDTPEGRLELYTKLNGLVLDDRPSNKFHGSTRGFKTPLHETLEVGGKTYIVCIDIDAMGRLTGTEIRNFTCQIYEY